jgi:hypothetical protein
MKRNEVMPLGPATTRSGSVGVVVVLIQSALLARSLYLVYTVCVSVCVCVCE